MIINISDLPKITHVCISGGPPSWWKVESAGLKIPYNYGQLFYEFEALSPFGIEKVIMQTQPDSILAVLKRI